MRLSISGRLAVAITCLLILVPFSGVQGSPAPVVRAATQPTGGPPSGSYTPASQGSGEVVSLRTRTSRTYLRDGHYVAEISTQSKNYKDAQGNWQPIDDSLVPATASGFAYQNAANRYTASFPSDLSTGPIREETSAGFIQFSLVGLSGAGSVSGNTDTFTIPGGSIAFASLPDQLKESITLSGPSSPSSFTYRVQWSSGLTPKKNSDGGIDFTDASGNIQFTFEPPTMQDAAGAISNSVGFTLLNVTSTSATVTVSGDPTWLASPSRAWPVIIDPSTNFTPSQQGYITAFGSGNTPTRQPVGGYQQSTNTWIYHTLMQFNLSTIPSNATVQNADLALTCYQATTTPIAVYQMTHSWIAFGSGNSHPTWTTYDGTNAWTNPGGDYNSTAAYGPINVGAANGGCYGNVYHWYPTSLVQNWVNGTTANYGFMIKETNEPTTETYTPEFSAEQLSVTYQPYTPTLGIQPWYAFAGPVNVANGNLVLSGSDMSMPGVGLNNSVGTTYNSLSTGTGDVGNGWLLDVGQDVNLHAYGDGSELLTGPTGFQAEFMSNGSGGYISPPGIDADLAKNQDGTFTLTDHASGLKMNFSSGGIPTSTVDRSGNTLAYAYTPNTTQLSSITDTLGQATNFYYDGSGRLTKITDPAQRNYQYAYDASSNLTSYTDPAGNVTHYAYDTNHLLTQITDPNGNITKIAYDGSRRVTSIINVTNVGAGTGPTTTYTYNSGNTVVTDPNSHQSTVHFDNQGRATSVTDAANHTVQTTWTSDNQVATTTLPSGIVTTNTFSTDGKNNLTGVTSKDASGQTSLSESWTYEDTNNPYLPTSYVNTQSKTTAYQYDTLGRLVAETDPKGGTITCAGAATNPVSTCSVYDSHGNVTSATDQNGHTTSYSYTTQGMPYQDTPPCPDGSTTRPCAGPPAPTPLGQTSYAFNSYNLESSVTDGNSQQTQYTYTADAEVNSITYADVTTTGTNCPSTGLRVNLCYTFDANGNVTSQTDSTGTTSYSYNALDQLVAESDPGQTVIPCPGTSVNGSTCYSYDAAGNLTSKLDGESGSTTCPGTTTTASTCYSYNADNSLASVTDRSGNTTTFQYDADGNLKTETLPNGVVQSVGYNTIDQLTSIGAKNAGNTQLTSYGFTYDKAQLASMTDTAGNVTSYTAYDANGQLTAANQKTSGGTTLNTYGYSYDAAWNLSGKTVNGTTTSFTYNANNLPTSASGGVTASYTYNGQGDLTARTVNGTNSSFTYNAGGQMTNLNGTSMTYTGIGETARTRAGSNTYQYDATGMRKQTAGGTATNFTTLPDGSIISETFSGSIYYFLTDGMGNVAALTDSAGTVVDQYSYDVMGNITSSSGSVSNPFTFQGWMYDSANNLYYTGSGYYDPATGQVIGCKDKGWVDPGEDGCRGESREDENPACHGVCTAASGAALAAGAAVSTAVGNGYYRGLGPPTHVPPGCCKGWHIGRPSGTSAKKANQLRYYDPQGGEWRFNPTDKWHKYPHWDYKPKGGSWQNVALRKGASSGKYPTLEEAAAAAGAEEEAVIEGAVLVGNDAPGGGSIVRPLVF